MRNVMRLSKLYQCILLATSSLMIACNAFASAPIAVTSVHKAEKNKDFVETNLGINHTIEWNLNVINQKAAAVLARDAANHNVYFSGPVQGGLRHDKDSQAVIIDGTDLTGHYINMSKGGSASLTMNPGSKADMVESGDNNATTDTTIVLHNTQLLGEQNGIKYDDKNKYKRYMHGSAIWAAKDNGKVNILADDHSVLNGHIVVSGTGDKNITLKDSQMKNGTISSGGKSQNNITLKNSQLSATDVTENAIDLRNAKENHVAIINSKVIGDKNIRSTDKHIPDPGAKDVSGTRDSDLSISGKSVDLGNINIQAAGKAKLNISDSSHKGDMNIDGAKGSSVFITDHATSTGNVTFGAGDNFLAVTHNSSLTGAVSNAKNILVSDDSQIMTSELKNAHLVLNNRGQFLTNSLNDSTVDMSSDSLLAANAAAGKNTVTISMLSAYTTAGEHEMAQYIPSRGTTVNTQFANGKTTSSARNGAYNYDLDIKTVATNEKTRAAKGAASQQSVVLVVKQAELANDVQSAVAGLDGAKESSRVITDSIANRMNTLNAGNLFYGVREGASVWGDYLDQDGKLKGNTDAKSKLQGLQMGADWTWKLSNGSSLTSGMVIGRVKDKVSHSSDSGDFNNHVTGDFYSLYAGWQQALQNNTWSLFANANVSYGDLDYSDNSNNVGVSTDGVKHHQTSSYKGNVLNAEMRSGVNIKVNENIVVQPYALAGVTKATADKFENKAITFDKNKSGSMYAGVGTRVTASIDVKHVKLMPWADANYTQDFNDKTRITAADYKLTSGKKQKASTFGVGLNAAVNKDLNLNSGVYTKSGDTSFRLGMNYNF